jgi:hypothetical protein
MSPPSPAPRSSRWFSALAALFTLCCLPLLFATRENNYTWDETSYHLPAIRQIREHWPGLDLLKDSLSATAPGYHYLLAGKSHLTGHGRLPLRLVNFTVSLGLLGLLWQIWPAGSSARLAFLAVLPLAASNFFVKSASCIVTDNAALLTIAGSLAALFFGSAPRGPRWSSGLATAAVCIRQSSVWLVMPLLIRLTGSGRSRVRWLLLAPPLLALGWLVAAWHGLVPPAWQDKHQATAGLVPAAGAYALSVLGILGAAYYAAGRPVTWTADLRNVWTGLGALAGLSLALAGPNVPGYTEGRWGGYLWDLAARLPMGQTYSPLFLLLAPVGGAVLAMLARRLWLEAGAAAALPWLAAYVAWLVSGLSNRLVFHRYFEPVTLVLLICWLALVIRSRPPVSSPGLKPLAILGAGQLLVTLLTAHARTFGLL